MPPLAAPAELHTDRNPNRDTKTSVRTPWARSPAWPAIRKASAELCRLSVQHHRAQLVFTSGKVTRDLFFEFMRVAPPKPVDVRRSHDKSWDCEWFQLEVPGVPLNVVRLPHFSRAGYEEFTAIAEWVAERLPRS